MYVEDDSCLEHRRVFSSFLSHKGRNLSFLCAEFTVEDKPQRKQWAHAHGEDNSQPHSALLDNGTDVSSEAAQ